MLPLAFLLLALLAEARPQGQPGDVNGQNGGSRESMTHTTVISTPSESSSSLESTSSSSSDSSKTGISTAVIVPVVVVIVLGATFLLIFKYRKYIASKWNERLSGTRRSRSGTESASRILTADELSGSPSRTDVNTNNGGGAGAANDNGNGNINRRGANGNGRPRRNRNGEYLRRTESGRSIRTLPVYSKEAGDEELVLVRRRSSSIMSDDTVILEHETIVEENESLPTHTRTSSEDAPRPEPTAEATVDFMAQPESPTGFPQSAPAATTQHPDRLSTPDATRHDSITRRGWGEAPTYLEAMSSPPFASANADLEAGTGSRPGPTLRTRTSSAFRDFLSRAGFSNPSRPMEMSQHPHSTTALPLLHPVTSRISTQSSLHARTPSSYPSPWHSSHSLIISSPIPNTAMRASFDSTAIPRAGLSDDQMRFLSSNEAVNLVGVRMQDPPEGRKNRRRRGSEAVSVLALGGDGEGEGEGGGEGPRTWEQSEEHRRSLILSPTPSAGGGEGSGSGTPQPEDAPQRGVASEEQDGQEERSPAEATIPKPSFLSASSPALLPPAPVFEIEPPTPIAGQMAVRIPSPTIRV
ncbi:hypothetical protein IAR50_002643 [Cryptococcus sp. DSM 104548]